MFTITPRYSHTRYRLSPVVGNQISGTAAQVALKVPPLLALALQFTGKQNGPYCAYMCVHVSDSSPKTFAFRVSTQLNLDYSCRDCKEKIRYEREIWGHYCWNMCRMIVMIVFNQFQCPSSQVSALHHFS